MVVKIRLSGGILGATQKGKQQQLVGNQNTNIATKNKQKKKVTHSNMPLDRLYL